MTTVTLVYVPPTVGVRVVIGRGRDCDDGRTRTCTSGRRGTGGRETGSTTRKWGGVTVNENRDENRECLLVSRTTVVGLFHQTDRGG